MSSESTKLISYQALSTLALNILKNAGMSEDEARQAAEALVDSDLRGVSTHGVKMLPLYFKKFQLGLFNPQPKIQQLRASGSIEVWDGDNGLGHPIAIRATQATILLAKTHGMASIAVRRTNHAGCMAYYPLLAAEEGFISFITTIAAQNMAPWGSQEPLLGNNPFAIAFPTPGDFHIVLDMATSTVSKGRVRLSIERGEKIPAGWAVTAEGKPVLDPSEFIKNGLGQFFLAPIGGPKGSGLSIINALLAGVLAGTDNLGLSLPSLTQTFDQVVDTGLFIQTLDPRCYSEWDTYTKRMKTFVQTIKEAQPLPNQDVVYLPGEVEHITKKTRMEQGIPLTLTIHDELKSLASIQTMRE